MCPFGQLRSHSKSGRTQVARSPGSCHDAVCRTDTRHLGHCRLRNPDESAGRTTRNLTEVIDVDYLAGFCVCQPTSVGSGSRRRERGQAGSSPRRSAARPAPTKRSKPCSRISGSSASQMCPCPRGPCPDGPDPVPIFCDPSLSRCNPRIRPFRTLYATTRITSRISRDLGQAERVLDRCARLVKWKGPVSLGFRSGT
jgi:hypothetical protein